MSALFSPLTLRDLRLPNRIVVSPMCQYTAYNGEAVHLRKRWYWRPQGRQAPKVPLRVQFLDARLSDIAPVERTKYCLIIQPPPSK
jgi:hypothetical protein